MQERLVQKKSAKKKARIQSQTRIIEPAIAYDVSSFSTADVIVVRKNDESSTCIEAASEKALLIENIMDRERVHTPPRPQAKRPIHPPRPPKPTSTPNPNKTKKSPKK